MGPERAKRPSKYSTVTLACFPSYHPIIPFVLIPSPHLRWVAWCAPIITGGPSLCSSSASISFIPLSPGILIAFLPVRFTNFIPNPVVSIWLLPLTCNSSDPSSGKSSASGLAFLSQSHVNTLAAQDARLICSPSHTTLQLYAPHGNECGPGSGWLLPRTA